MRESDRHGLGRIEPVLIMAAVSLVSAGCEKKSEGDSRSITRLSTMNTGTTVTMDLLFPADSDVRENCDEWYGNNLCLLESELLVAEALRNERPDIAFLQEIWTQSGCEDTDRPREVNESPYACAAGPGEQIERILPEGYSYACASEYPDNCIAFRTKAFQPVSESGEPGECAGLDCSDHMVSNPAECGRDGRIAYIRGTTIHGPAMAVVVHTNSGTDDLCRAQQLDSIQAVLEAEPTETVIFMAGDFNMDPEIHHGEDVDAFWQLVEAVSLERIPDDEDTHRILKQDLDIMLTRNWPGSSSVVCHVSFLDEGTEVPMFDHAFLLCE